MEVNSNSLLCYAANKSSIRLYYRHQLARVSFAALRLSSQTTWRVCWSSIESVRRCFSVAWKPPLAPLLPRTEEHSGFYLWCSPTAVAHTGPVVTLQTGEKVSLSFELQFRVLCLFVSLLFRCLVVISFFVFTADLFYLSRILLSPDAFSFLPRPKLHKLYQTISTLFVFPFCILSSFNFKLEDTINLSKPQP